MWKVGTEDNGSILKNINVEIARNGWIHYTASTTQDGSTLIVLREGRQAEALPPLPPAFVHLLVKLLNFHATFIIFGQRWQIPLQTPRVNVLRRQVPYVLPSQHIHIGVRHRRHRESELDQHFV